METLEYIKINLKDQSIMNEDIALAKLCMVENNHKHTAHIGNNLLNIVYKGTKILHTSKGNIKINAGEAFFITKGEYIMSEIISQSDYECLLIYFNHEKAKKVIEKLPFKLYGSNKTNNQSVFKFELNSPLQNTVDTLKSYLEDKPQFSDELITLKLTELMLLILGTKVKDNFISFCHNLIDDKTDLKSFMENNFEKSLTIKEFASLSGRSLSGFNSEFKSIFKQSPMRWLLKKRVEKGKFLIHELGYDVGTAALSVGFKTHAHFSRVYKQQYNVSPSFTDK